MLPGFRYRPRDKKSSKSVGQQRLHPPLHTTSNRLYLCACVSRTKRTIDEQDWSKGYEDRDGLAEAGRHTGVLKKIARGRRHGKGTEGGSTAGLPARSTR